MSVEMPKIEVTFRQKAASLISRSERGIVSLIIRDDTEGALPCRSYNSLVDLEADKSCYTAENYAAISDILAFAPYQTFVFKLGSDGLLGDVLTTLKKKTKTGWITMANMTPEDATALVSWIKEQERQYRSYKAVVYKPSVAPDCMHVVNFGNETVTFSDERGEQNGAAYLPSLAGILAVCNVQRGCLDYHCSNLADVEEFEDNNDALRKGLLILTHDENGDVRIGQGNNSMTTTDGLTRTEDMQYIETVEAMDLMRDDIISTFRQTYLGKYRNNLDNQMLFIAALNHSYFNQLAQENILDPSYENVAEIDVAAQREAWIASGKADAASWDDDQVKNMPFKRTVFLAGNVKILYSMTDLIFPITIA